MAKHSIKRSQPHWYKMMSAIALLAAATVAGFAAADSRTTLGARSAVDSAASAARARVTVIHKDPQGLWPEGNVWVGRTNCNKGGSAIVETTRCAVVINSTIGIDV